MDELEKKEEVTGQKTVEGTVEAASEEQPEGALEEEKSTVEEQETAEEEIEETAESKSEMEAEEAAAELKMETMLTKEKGNLLASIAGFFVFFGLLLAIWQMPGSGTENGILYAKDNNLYYYDLENDPYLVQENISSGASYHYYYSAWGASVAEEGKWAYYAANINDAGDFDLYRRDVSKPSAEPIWIDAGVCDYQVSKDGNVAAYLVLDGDSLHMCTFDGKNRTIIAEDLQWQDNLYTLSGDGKYLIYYDAYGMLRVRQVDGKAANVVLTDAAPIYILAEEKGLLYYVSQNGDTYDIYSYDFQNPAVLETEKVSYVELMPNGRDLLYCAMPAENVPYSEIIVDDMAEADAALTEADGEAYEAKLQRDEIREAMANGEGIDPLLLDCYILINGEYIEKVAENVVSAMAVDHEMPFVTGYQAKAIEPMPLSLLEGGLEMLDMYYYMTLSYGGLETFLANTDGICETLTGYQVLPETLQVSDDGMKAAYFATDPNLGGNILMEMEVGKAVEAAAVEMDVESFGYLGGSDLLCYYHGTTDGTGILTAGEKSVSDVAGVEFAEDRQAAYYIVNPDRATGVGQMQIWDGVNEPEIIDGGVFAFQNKGDGRLVLISGYDVYSGLGDLHYYDGESSIYVLDEDITAVFMY